jgi:hypothetical protein
MNLGVVEWVERKAMLKPKGVLGCERKFKATKLKMVKIDSTLNYISPPLLKIEF